MAIQIMAAALLAAAPASTQSAVRPSFQCTARLSSVEAMICADEELSAYDAAMANFYRHRTSGASASISQSDWLKRRNACGNRNCLLSLYDEWISESEVQVPWTHERKRRKPDGSDLMLGTLQSPTGKVKALGDSGGLYIKRLGGDWYAFSAFAVHLYDPHDGRGPNESDSSAVGVVKLTGGSGTWIDRVEDGCRVQLRRINRHAWELRENGTCSGVGSSLDGVYYSNR